MPKIFIGAFVIVMRVSCPSSSFHLIYSLQRAPWLYWRAGDWSCLQAVCTVQRTVPPYGSILEGCDLKGALHSDPSAVTWKCALHLGQRKTSEESGLLCLRMWCPGCVNSKAVLGQWWCCTERGLTGTDFLRLCTEWASEFPSPVNLPWLYLEHCHINRWNYLQGRGLTRKIRTEGFRLILYRSSAAPHQ